jgi:DNA-binding winged helix-turn-helix (wHTH) protein
LTPARATPAAINPAIASFPSQCEKRGVLIVFLLPEEESGAENILPPAGPRLSISLRFALVIDSGRRSVFAGIQSRTPMRFRFGDCVFDRQTRELHRGGSPVHLTPKVFAFLEILLDRRPSAVPKEKLIAALWPGVFVGDGNLSRLAAELRDAIGDDAHSPRFVRTVARFGYAFHGEAVEAGPTGAFRAGPGAHAIVWGDREFALSQGENLMGRDPTAHVSIDNPSVSRHHARVLIDGLAARLEDLGSKNGTYIDERRVDAAAPLRDGSSIRLGTVVLVFRRLAAGAATETASSRQIDDPNASPAGSSPPPSGRSAP